MPVSVLRVVIATAIVVLVGRVLSAQGTRQPTMQNIRGRVVAAGTGTPIPYARIRVSGANWSVRSDIDGAFALEVPRTGTLIVSKVGMVSIERALPLADSRLEFGMTRAAALSGRVIDQFGQPIVAATVTAAVSNSQARPGAQAGGNSSLLHTTTDDRGDYRIGGLSPAGYRVTVQTIGATLVAMPTSASSAANGAPPPITGYTQTSATTYFPDTLEPERAADIVVGEGDERRGIDFHIPADRASRQSVLVTLALTPPLVVDPRGPDADGATIRGTVTDPQGRPLPYAQVTIDGIATGSVSDAQLSLQVYRTMMADEQGTYRFAGLRLGFYTIRAEKAGYSPRPLDPGRPTPTAISNLKAGEVRVQDVTLIPWGAISGQLKDEFGDPAHGGKISLYQSRYERGRRRLVEARVPPRTTDDLGEFRLFAIPPGEYVVTATIADAIAPDLVGYAQTFYPGGSGAGDGWFVPVEPGSDISGLDFSLIATRSSRVTGTTFDPAGQPTTQLRLTLVSRTGVGVPLNAAIEVDGTFEFENVPPGQYVLKADGGRTNTFTEGSFVAMPVSVGNEDVTGLRVQARTGSTITGRFVFDRTVRRSDPPPTAVTITAVPDDYDLAPTDIASTQANAEGVFQLRGVTGPRRLQVTRVPPRYMVKAVLVNGRDVTDELVTFGRAGEPPPSVEVVLTDRVTQLSVTVADARQPRGRAHVLLFSTDRERWYPASRHVRHEITDANGRVAFDGLPVGNYFAAAVLSVPEGTDAWQDPTFLESVRDQAVVTSVGDGGSDTVNLRLSGR